MPVEDSAPLSSKQLPEIPEMRNPGIDVIAKFREVTDSPSPLTLFLQDPAVIELSRSRNRNGRKPSRSPHSERRSPSMMALALVEEERQVSHLKALLRNASDRLEYEIRRADEADMRADYAELRGKELSAKLNASETARRQAEAACEKSTLENRRYKSQLENAERERERLQRDVTRLQKDNDTLEESWEKARETSRQFQTALREHQAREEGAAEVRRIAMLRCFNDGREEGWSVGHDEGFEEGRDEGFTEGRRVGRKEGLREGKELGRTEERRNALEAFDRFLNDEVEGHDNGRDERIRRWAESVYHPNPVPASETPQRRPTASPRHR